MISPCPISSPGGWGSQKPPLGVSIDRGHPLARGILAKWTFADGAGKTLSDVSGMGHNGTLVGCSWVGSARGQALSFNGTSDYVDCGKLNHNIGTGNFSVATWSYTPTVIGGIRCLWSNGEYDPASYGIVSTPRNYFYWGEDCYFPAPYPIAGQWNFQVVVRQAGIISCYTNNVPSAVTFNIATSMTNAIWRIGWDTYATNFWRGLIGDVAVYNRALRADEIGRLYREPYCMFEAGLPSLRDAPARPLVDGSPASASPLLGAVA